ncbi:MAG: hypothetical protein Q9165_000619 [Trypethelium subeluteriae]
MSAKSSPQFSFQSSPHEAPDAYQTAPSVGEGGTYSEFGEYSGSTNGARYVSAAPGSRRSRIFTIARYVFASLVLMAIGAGLTLLIVYLMGDWTSKGTSQPLSSIRNALGDPQDPQDAPDTLTLLFGCPANLNQTDYCEQIPNWNASKGVPGPYVLPKSLGGGRARWFVNHSIIDEIVNVTAVQQYPQTIFFAQFTQNGSVEKIQPSTWPGGDLPLANNSQENIGPFQEVIPLTSTQRARYERRGEDAGKEHNVSDDHTASNLTENKMSMHHGHKHNCTDMNSRRFRWLTRSRVL